MKTIYDFHYNIVKKHIIELEEKNETTIKSGFLFDIFKKQYTTHYNVTKIQSDTTFVFHWSGTRSDKKCKYPNPKYILHLIDKGCINASQVKSLLKLDYYWMAKKITENDIDVLFNKSTPKEIRYELLDKCSDNYCKFGLVSGFVCHKLYYKIQK
jgi:hypothetical protein